MRIPALLVSGPNTQRLRARGTAQLVGGDRRGRICIKSMYTSCQTPPPHSNTFPCRPLAPQDRTNVGIPEETGQGERETQGKVTGHGRPHSPKMMQSAEGGTGKDKEERIIVVVRSPCHENGPADAHTGAHKSVLSRHTPQGTRSVHLDAPGHRHGQQPVSGTADPRSSQTGQVIRGLR